MEILNLGGSYEPTERSSKKKVKVVLGIGLLAGVMGLGSTLAATVTINTGGAVEFGQGVAASAACDTDLNITPASTYVNDTQTTTSDFQLSSIVITNLNTTTLDTASAGNGGCGGGWLVIKAYTNTDSIATNYAVGDASTPLYLTWNYPSPSKSGGKISGYQATNSGFAVRVNSTAGGNAANTVNAIGHAGAGAAKSDVGGITCAQTSSGTTATITCTIGISSATQAKMGVSASAVSKITVESGSAAPSGYTADTGV